MCRSGVPIELVMTSEDVIHDFSVPAFRIKHDVLPGRYETLWFTPDAPGTYHLFCTQFCGTDHARMIGEVDVLTPARVPALAERNGGADTLAADGRVLFMRYGCSGCHGGNGAGGEPGDAAPCARRALAGLYGSPVPLSDGTRGDGRRALHPRFDLDAGRSRSWRAIEAIMPSFAGQIGEEDLIKLIAYIKSLTPGSNRMSGHRRDEHEALVTAGKIEGSYLTDG